MRTRLDTSTHLAGRLCHRRPPGRIPAGSGRDDLVIRLWDPASGAHLHTLAGHSRSVWPLAFSPSGALLASGGDDGTARLWSVAGGRPAMRITLLGLPHYWAARAPDGRYKIDGDIEGQFWHVIGMCRFETGSWITRCRRSTSFPPTPF